MTTVDSNDVNQVRSADGTAIAFESVGSGPAVIIVGPASADSADPPGGQELQAQLATAHTVYTYDRRSGSSAADVDREVEDLAALIAEAGGSAYLYGVSSGARLAIQAVAAGLPVDRVAVFDAPTGGKGPGEQQTADAKGSGTVRTLIIDSDTEAVAPVLLEYFGS